MRSFRGCHNFWIFVAIEEGITTVSFWAWANRVVVYNFTFSISSTGSWTGIKASLLDTSLCKLTFRAKKALRPAIRRDAKETREPSANRSSTLGSVFTAWSKWIWITKILWFNCYSLKRNDDTLCTEIIHRFQHIQGEETFCHSAWGTSPDADIIQSIVQKVLYYCPETDVF